MSKFASFNVMVIIAPSTFLNPIQGGGAKNTCDPLFHQITVEKEQ